MIRIVFKNLHKSELAREAVEAKLEEAMDRFPDLRASRVVVTLSMDNSPRQTGADVFRVLMRVENGKYKGVIIEKSAPNLYVALGDISEHLLERLNRLGDKIRVKARAEERKFLSRSS